MKKMLLTVLAGWLFTSGVYAQDTTTVGQDIKNAAVKTGDAVEKTAKKVGNKSAQIAANGKAKVVDQVYKGKVGPGGHAIYIDNNSKYYWIDKKGHKHSIAESALKNKPE